MQQAYPQYWPQFFTASILEWKQLTAIVGMQGS
jgi:hypothetical protein